MKPVAVVGSTFTGYCSICDETVTGTMVGGEFVTIDGAKACVTGSPGVGSCGHTTHAVGQSVVFFINGKPVARVGDPVQGTINGVLVSGSFVLSE